MCKEIVQYYCCYRWYGLIPGPFHYLTVGAKHNNNRNNTNKNWIILLNIINLKIRNIQHYLDYDAALIFLKEVQTLGWLNFVSGADLLWLVSHMIQQPKNIVWLEQPLHKVFIPKTSPERTPFFVKNFSIFLVYMNAWNC